MHSVKHIVGIFFDAGICLRGVTVQFCGVVSLAKSARPEYQTAAVRRVASSSLCPSPICFVVDVAELMVDDFV